MNCFENKVVLVTGASSGIGGAAAILFSKKGAKVALVARNEEKLKSVASQCKKNGPSPLLIKADVADDSEADGVVSKTIKTFGKLDVLVNNAGIVRFASLLDGDIVKTYDEIAAVNVRAQIYITNLAVPHLIKTKGNVINISSVAATSVASTPLFAPYHVSKAALNMFSRCAAQELAPKGVRVNTVSPGPVKTDIMENANISYSIESAKTMLGRVSEPEEVAELIAFLASDKAVAITGADYITDNGYLLNP